MWGHKYIYTTNTVHVQREHVIQQLAGEQYKMIVVHEHVNIHILLSLLWMCTHGSVRKSV